MNNGYKVWCDPYLRLHVLKWNRPLRNRFDAARAAELDYVEFFMYTVDEVYCKNWAIQEAISAGHLELLKWMYLNWKHLGLNFLSEDSLFHAHQHYDVFMWLIDKGASLHGTSLWSLMCYTKTDLKVIQYLFWIDPTRIDQAEFDWAAKHNRADVMEWLQSHNKEIRNELFLDTYTIIGRCGYVDALRYILDHEPPERLVGYYTNHVLYMAILANQVEMVKYILEQNRAVPQLLDILRQALRAKSFKVAYFLLDNYSSEQLDLSIFGMAEGAANHNYPKDITLCMLKKYLSDNKVRVAVPFILLAIAGLIKYKGWW